MVHEETSLPHANEIEPQDLGFTMKLIGFKECRWAVFKGEKISKQRINHFVTRTTELTEKIPDSKLKTAFQERINQIRTTFDKQGGISHHATSYTQRVSSQQTRGKDYYF